LSAEYDDDVQAYRHSQGLHCNRFIPVFVECFDVVEHANGSRVEDGDGEEHEEEEEEVEEEVIELKSCDDEEESGKESSSGSKSIPTRI